MISYKVVTNLNVLCPWMMNVIFGKIKQKKFFKTLLSTTLSFSGYCIKINLLICETIDLFLNWLKFFKILLGHQTVCCSPLLLLG